MGIEDPAIWLVGAGIATAFRPVQNIIIFFMAVHGAKPCERREIIEALANTRQFGLWSKPQWPRRKPKKLPPGPPGIEQIEPQPADDEAA